MCVAPPIGDLVTPCSTMSAPAGRPTADRRVVHVGDVPVYLERDHVAVTLTLTEAAVVLHALAALRA